MKRTLILVSLAAIIGAISTTWAQAPETDEQQLLALMKDVQAQQAQIRENQTKMDAKLGEIAENIRVAHIFSERTQ